LEKLPAGARQIRLFRHLSCRGGRRLLEAGDFLSSFEEFVRDRGGPLLAFATALCGERGLAEDVSQEVFLRAQARWASVGVMEFPEAYVRKMLVNEFLGWQRKWGRVRPQAEVEPLIHLPDHAAAHAERDALLAEIGKLPARQRAVIALRYYADLSDEEIADALGCRTSSVRTYCSRALRTLRVVMEPNHAVKGAS
jgi:RNA polymerase sigma-70 factor (sigma-E family)